jgi:hypothetical protein
VVAIPELGRNEHVFAFDAAIAECGANIRFVTVNPRGVDMAVSCLQRVFYCFLGYLPLWRLVDSEAEAWNHDSIVEFGNRFDCGLHVVGNVEGSTSTLIPEKLFEKGVFWKGRSAIQAGFTFTCVRGGSLSRMGIPQKL